MNTRFISSINTTLVILCLVIVCPVHLPGKSARPSRPVIDIEESTSTFMPAIEEELAKRQTEEYSFAQQIEALHTFIGNVYPCFDLKGIEWQEDTKDLMSRRYMLDDEDQFALLAMELIAKTQDSHAGLFAGTATPPEPPLPQWVAPVYFLRDNRNRPVVFQSNLNENDSRIKVGDELISVNGVQADTFIEKVGEYYSKYVGVSSPQQLDYLAVRKTLTSISPGKAFELELRDLKGGIYTEEVYAKSSYYGPWKLPVPMTGLKREGVVSWKKLTPELGYIYLSGIKGPIGLIMESAMQEMEPMEGLIIDVRGNGGGGFDTQTAYRSFIDSPDTPEDYFFEGPVVILTDSGCMSAGEGWSSWFYSSQRATFIGETTAGASSRKEHFPLLGGKYLARIPVKAYTGFLDRPIEYIGILPHLGVRPNREDLARGIDTVVEAAIDYLEKSQDKDGSNPLN